MDIHNNTEEAVSKARRDARWRKHADRNLRRIFDALDALDALDAQADEEGLSDESRQAIAFKYEQLLHQLDWYDVAADEHERRTLASNRSALRWQRNERRSA